MKSSTVHLQGMAPLLQVFDMPTSLKFYRDMLGFKIADSSGEGDDVDWVLLKKDRIELMLNTAYEKKFRPFLPDPIRIEWHKDLTLYFGCHDIDETFEALSHKGMKLMQPSKTGYGWKALNFYDPDGYQICIHTPNE